MCLDQFDGETVTIELDADELDRIDDIAFSDHRDNREAAIRTLLDEWIKSRTDGTDDVDGSEND